MAIPTRNEVLTFIKGYLSDMFTGISTDRITPEMSLDTIGVTSLDVLDMAMNIQDKYDLPIDPSDSLAKEGSSITVGRVIDITLDMACLK